MSDLTKTTMQNISDYIEEHFTEVKFNLFKRKATGKEYTLDQIVFRYLGKQHPDFMLRTPA